MLRFICFFNLFILKPNTKCASHFQFWNKRNFCLFICVFLPGIWVSAAQPLGRQFDFSYQHNKTLLIFFCDCQTESDFYYDLFIVVFMLGGYCPTLSAGRGAPAHPPTHFNAFLVTAPPPGGFGAPQGFPQQGYSTPPQFGRTSKVHHFLAGS